MAVNPGVSFLKAGGQKPIVVAEPDPDEEARRKEPSEVWLHNDSYTPAEYVVKILQQVFALGLWKATWIMTKAHVTGEAMVGVYPLEEARTKVHAAHERAREDGWPLRLSVQSPSA
jgi:ATP-dependent Clp protease adaptor protein ClpS